MTSKTEHLTPEDLTDLALGEALGDRRDAINEHLQNCRSCLSQSRRTADIIATARQDATVDVPSFLSERVIDFFDEHRIVDVNNAEPGLVEKLTAFLVNDRLVPLTGLRAGSNDYARQLIYASGEMVFEMGLEQYGLDSWQIAGSANIPYVGGTMQLKDDQGRVISTELDDLSYFSFPPVGSGSYSAIYLHNNIRIEFEPRIVI